MSSRQTQLSPKWFRLQLCKLLCDLCLWLFRRLDRRWLCMALGCKQPFLQRLVLALSRLSQLLCQVCSHKQWLGFRRWQMCHIWHLERGLHVQENCLHRCIWLWVDMCQSSNKHKELCRHLQPRTLSKLSQVSCHSCLRQLRLVPQTSLQKYDLFELKWVLQSQLLLRLVPLCKALHKLSCKPHRVQSCHLQFLSQGRLKQCLCCLRQMSLYSGLRLLLLSSLHRHLAL